MIKSTFTLILMTLLICCSCSDNLIETTTIAELDSTLEKYYEDSNIPGISLMAVRGDEVNYTKDLGYANMREGLMYDSHSVQSMGSVSKTFLAVALMKAEELGLLDLDTDVNAYLPFKLSNPNFPKATITLQHLATHSSGIRDLEEIYLRSYYFENATDLDFESFPLLIEGDNVSIIRNNELIDNAEFIEKVFSTSGEFFSPQLFMDKAPGTNYEYTNLGSSLTGYIIEKVSGITYEEFVIEHIANPLGMENVYWSHIDVPAELLAEKYLNRDRSIPHYHLITKADGGLYTSLNDLSKFLIDIGEGYKGNGQLLSAESYNKMFYRYKIGKTYSGIFWEVDNEGVIKHTGSDPGTLAVVGYNPNKDLSYLLATNCSAELEANMVKPLKRMFKTMTNHQF